MAGVRAVERFGLWCVLSLGISACGGRASSSSPAVAGRAGSPPTTASPGGVSSSGAGGEAGGDSEPSVSPEVSARWTWSPCGTISPSSPAIAAALSANGERVAVLDEDNAVSVYDASGTEPAVVFRLDGARSAVAFSPNGVFLAVSGPGSSQMFPLTPSPGVPMLASSPDGACASQALGFSLDGKYLVAYGADAPACVWNLGDGSLVIRTQVTLSAAVRDESLVDIESGASDAQVAIVTRDFSGAELARQSLELPESGSAVLSPAGDRVVVLGSSVRLIDVATGSVLVSLADAAYSATFDYRGDLVRFGGSVFDTSTGARKSSAVTDERDALFWPSAAAEIALTPDATQELVLSQANAGLRRLDTAGFARVFGGPGRPPLARGKVAVRDLAISADGSLLVLQGGDWYAYGLRISEHFEASSLAWWAFAPDTPFISDLSLDGKWLAVSGDNRVLVDTTDGHVRWPSIAPPPSAACWGSQLRFSPSGKWAAGDSYGETIDVFAVAASDTAFPTPSASLPAGGCIDALAFSRDEQLMATSGPELYTTGERASDWKMLWNARPADSGGPFDGVESEVRFSPDQQSLLVSRCSLDVSCVAELHSVTDGSVLRALPELTAPHPAFSSEGQWLVSGATLLHLPSGQSAELASSGGAAITSAIFAPNGDVIAGFDDLSVTRYCRSQ